MTKWHGGDTVALTVSNNYTVPSHCSLMPPLPASLPFLSLFSAKPLILGSPLLIFLSIIPSLMFISGAISDDTSISLTNRFLMVPRDPLDVFDVQTRFNIEFPLFLVQQIFNMHTELFVPSIFFTCSACHRRVCICCQREKNSNRYFL